MSEELLRALVPDGAPFIWMPDFYESDVAPHYEAADDWITMRSGRDCATIERPVWFTRTMRVEAPHYFGRVPLSVTVVWLCRFLAEMQSTWMDNRRRELTGWKFPPQPSRYWHFFERPKPRQRRSNERRQVFSMTPEERQRREEKVLLMRANGATYRQIGAHIGVSSSRASQVVAKAERRRRQDVARRSQSSEALFKPLSQSMLRRLHATVNALWINPPQRFLARLFPHLAASTRNVGTREICELPAVNPDDVAPLIDQLKAKGWTNVRIARELSVSATMIHHYQHRRFKPTDASRYAQKLRELLAA